MFSGRFGFEEGLNYSCHILGGYMKLLSRWRWRISANKSVLRSGVAGGATSGKTIVCDMIIEHLCDQRVVFVNQDSFSNNWAPDEFTRAQEYKFDHSEVIWFLLRGSIQLTCRLGSAYYSTWLSVNMSAVKALKLTTKPESKTMFTVIDLGPGVQAIESLFLDSSI